MIRRFKNKDKSHMSTSIRKQQQAVLKLQNAKLSNWSHGSSFILMAYSGINIFIFLSARNQISVLITTLSMSSCLWLFLLSLSSCNLKEKSWLIKNCCLARFSLLMQSWRLHGWAQMGICLIWSSHKLEDRATPSTSQPTRWSSTEEMVSGQSNLKLNGSSCTTWVGVLCGEISKKWQNGTQKQSHILDLL